MQFIDQASGERANFGTYLLTITLVLSALVVGQLVAESIAVEYMGFSFLNIPKNVDRNNLLILLILPFIFAFFTLMASLKWLHHRAVLSAFTSRERFDWKRFILAFVIWGGVLGISLLIGILAGAPIEFHFDQVPFFRLLLIALFILPFQTFAEDLFFRGFLLQGLRRFKVPAIIPILITGVIFGTLHMGNPEVNVLGLGLIAYYILTGVFLSLLTHMDDGMELGMGYHAVNNIFAAIILTNDWQVFQTDALFIDHSTPTFGWDALLTILVLQPLLLFIFSRVYKWKSFRFKLFQS